MFANTLRSVIVLSAISGATVIVASPAIAADCGALLDEFNRAIDRGLDAEAQAGVDKIATSAECGRYQIPAQIRLAALRLAAVQGMMARGRPASDFDRLLIAAESPEVLWQASATMGEVRFGERRFAEAAQAYDRAIEIVKNETLTPTAPSKFEIESLFDRSAQSRLLAANISASTTAPGTPDAQNTGPKFVKTARDQRDGTLGGIYSRSVRGIMPRAVPVPITFDYAKTSFTGIGDEAARELATALREQHPSRITLIGHTDVRGNAETNLKLSRARADAVAAFLKENGVEISITTEGKGANEPMRLSDTSGLSQDDIYALNRRVEWRRE